MTAYPTIDKQTKPSVMIVNSTLHIGGAEQVAACLAQGLDRDAFDVFACYLKEPGMVADQMARGGVRFLPLPGLQPGRRDYLTSLKLRSLIISRGINIIHTHDIHSLADGAVCRTLIPNIRFVHTFHFGNYPQRRRRHQIIERSLWRIPDAIVAVGHAQARTIQDFYGIPPGRLRVIWNGVDDPTKHDRQEPPANIESLDRPLIGSVSTLIHQKGLDFLLQAAAQLRDSGDKFTLAIAGDGHLRDSLRAQARELRLDNHVRFLGWVPQASQRVLPACDIFVQPSRWEAMSVVVLEAMAAGKPMVVTQVGENPHVVVEGETGLIVPPGNPQALADGLRTLLRDPIMRERMGRAARKRYEAKFTTRHMISAYELLYHELMGDASSAARTDRAETA